MKIESEIRCLANLSFKNDRKMRFSLEKLLEDGLFARENERRCWKQNSDPLESRWTSSCAVSSNFLYMLRFFFLLGLELIIIYILLLLLKQTFVLNLPPFQCSRLNVSTLAHRTRYAALCHKGFLYSRSTSTS